MRGLELELELDWCQVRGLELELESDWSWSERVGVRVEVRLETVWEGWS